MLSLEVGVKATSSTHVSPAPILPGLTYVTSNKLRYCSGSSCTAKLFAESVCLFRKQGENVVHIAVLD
jgi:hypothetical protein